MSRSDKTLYEDCVVCIKRLPGYPNFYLLNNKRWLIGKVSIWKYLLCGRGSFMPNCGTMAEFFLKVKSFIGGDTKLLENQIKNWLHMWGTLYGDVTVNIVDRKCRWTNWKWDVFQVQNWGKVNAFGCPGVNFINFFAPYAQLLRSYL